MRQLEKYCKNCGANIDDSTQVCPDCGREIPAEKYVPRHHRKCPNCGRRILGYEQFCRSCGIDLSTAIEEKPASREKYKTPITTIAIIAVIAIVAFGAFNTIMPMVSQEVQVDTINFKIPPGYVQDDDLTFDETDAGVKYVSKFWENDEDDIQIDVTYSQNGTANANDALKEVGGTKQNMMNYDGYYDEVEGYYSFSFVKDNKIISIYTSNHDLLNEIEVL